MPKLLYCLCAKKDNFSFKSYGLADNVEAFFHDNIDLWLNNFLLGVKEIISMEVKIFFIE